MRFVNFNFFAACAIAVCCVGCDPSSVDTIACLSADDCAGGQVCFRGTCAEGCIENGDCPTGQVCSGGACTSSSSSSCVSAADCITPPSVCQTTQGVTCESGRCVFPPTDCGPPPDPVCSADDMFFTTFANGQCSEETGCVFEENTSECANCSENCAGRCDPDVCSQLPSSDELGCRASPSLRVNDGVCSCEFNSVQPDGTRCFEDDEDPCTRDAVCVGGECQQELIVDGESCVDENDEDTDGVCFQGACVDCIEATLDCPDDNNQCTVRTCEGNSCGVMNREGACTLDLDGEEVTGICSLGRCVECLVQADCNDGNSCTVDACSPDGLCVEPAVPVGDPCIGEAGICNESAECVECLNSANEPDGSNARCETDSGFGAIDIQCQIATCDADDSCEIVSVPDDTSCDDGLSSTGQDQCFDGRCDGCVLNDCQTFVRSGGVCSATDEPPGTACSTGANGAAASNNAGTCSRGFCLECSRLNNFSNCENYRHDNDGDSNVSLSDDCTNVGFAASEGRGCSDGNQCTSPDRCDGTECVSGSIQAGATCNDNNACSTASACTASGACAGTSFVDCDSGETCINGSCVCQVPCTQGPSTICCSGGQICCNNGLGCRANQNDCQDFGP